MPPFDQELGIYKIIMSRGLTPNDLNIQMKDLNIQMKDLNIQIPPFDQEFVIYKIIMSRLECSLKINHFKIGCSAVP